MIDRLRVASETGWLSIGFWICVQAFQIQENYTLQSGEGLSIWFILIWLAGDLANMLGAFWQGLLPTISYLGLYYVLCDLTLLAQVIYYREKRRRSPDLSSSGETTALLGSEESSEEKCHAKKMLESESFIGTLALLFVAFVGVFGWFITAPSKGKVPREIWENKAQIVGWISAILYLTSRFPQILKNTESKCEGLSLLFFFFALAGNVTFCASILIPSTDTNHMIINMSWLVGSAGTILLDFVVLFQFAYYAKERKRRLELGESWTQHETENQSGLAGA